MSLDQATLEAMRRQHPAWRLLAADSAPLVASFLHRVFIEPNVRTMAQSDLVEALEDTLFALRDQRGAEAWPKSPQEYLNDWAANDKGWLRKFYPPGSDEPHFDLTPATEKAIAWLVGLSERSFVGTESRLLTLFELLRQMNEGSQAEPAARLRDLERRREDVDAEIERVRQGDFALMSDTALKERFQQFAALARELLADFREVEHNFRALDRRVRERIALWDGRKGELLHDILGERDLIADSDQGRSFRAFGDFLMSQARQEELTQLLERVLNLMPVAELAPDARIKRVHYDWLEAGEHAQRTVALLSQQLRRRRRLRPRSPARSSRLATRMWTPRPCIRSSSSTRTCSHSTSAARCRSERRSRSASCWSSIRCARGWPSWSPTCNSRRSRVRQ